MSNVVGAGLAPAQDGRPQGTAPTAQDGRPQGTAPTAQDGRPQGTAPTAQDGRPQGTAPAAQDGRPRGTAPTWYDAEDLRWAARHWATKIGVHLRQVSVRPMTTKWASMSTAGRLTLNSELVTMPVRLGEFVIVHELVHLLAPNHGKVFASFMAAYMPDWDTRERDLHNYGRTRKDGVCPKNKAKRARSTPTTS